MSEALNHDIDSNSPIEPRQPENSSTETQDIAGGQSRTEHARAIGPYKLRQLIGEGGMGEVWLAEQDTPVRRRVALKLIKRGLDSREVIGRFESERQALALMDHSAIAKIFDAGSTSEGHPYFAMEYVPGLDICTYCDRHKLNTRERLDLFVKVCQGVQHAHRKAVIHRDLKPSNILVCEVDGKASPKIIDFGIAKAISQRLTPNTVLTRLGAVIGTPEYMSPEQFDSGGEDIDTRTDVFSLGVVLYQLLLGRFPTDYRKLAWDEIVRAIREQDAPRPSAKLRTTGFEEVSIIARDRRTEPRTLYRELRGDLDAIVLKALEKDRRRRYGGASEFAADINRYLADQPIVARPASFTYRARKAFVRNKIAAVSAICLFALLSAFSITEAFQVRRITAERDRSERTAEFMTEMFRVPHHGMGPGLSITAEEILDKASQTLQFSYEMDPITQARLKAALGTIYYDLGGSNSRAEALIADALRLQTIAKGKDDPETLHLSRLLGVIMGGATGKAAQSEALLRQTLITDRRVLGSHNVETSNAMVSLGLSVWHHPGPDRGRESEMLFREALDVQRKVLGSTHPTTLETLFLLTESLRMEQKYADAEKFARELVDDAHRNLAHDDELPQSAVWLLARILDNEKKYAAAEDQARELVELQNRFPADEKLQSFSGMSFLVHVLMEEGKYDEAEAIGGRLVSLERSAFGPDHPRLGRTIYNLACVAALTGKKDRALGLLREAFQHGLSAEDVAEVTADPDMNSMRSDPRFVALLGSLRAKNGNAGHP